MDFTDHKFEQPDLFMDKPILHQNYRHKDPESSKQAGIEIRRSGKANTQMHVLEYLVGKYPGKSSKYLERIAIEKEPLLLRLTHNQMARRVGESELVEYDKSVMTLDNCHPIILK